MIGATTFEEYRKVIEPEQAFNRRFEALTILEPDMATCIKMIEVVLENYQKHHQIEVEKEALPDACVLPNVMPKVRNSLMQLLIC